MRYVTTAFIFYENKLLVVHHKRIKKWMHVGGHVEPDEDLEESLFREIKEETGLVVKILNPEDNYLFNHFLHKDIHVEIKPLIRPMFIHRAKTDRGVETIFDYVCVAESDDVILQKEELLDYRWIGKDEIDSLDAFPLWKELALRAFEVYNKKI